MFLPSYATKERISPKCPIQTLILPGQELFIARPYYRLYIKAITTEAWYVLADPNSKENGVWVGFDKDGELNEGHKPVTDSMMIVNQFPWVDWDLGHAAYIGDDAFFTLEEARKTYGRFSSKGKYRRARKDISNTHKFIESTWRKAGDYDTPGFPTIKSYYRRIYT